MAKSVRPVPAPVTAKILIVDDDERNAFAAREALTILGHEIVVARSGEEALRTLLTQEFAVILLDLHMPGMDGYETAKLIREHPRIRDTPIVFVTAVFRDEAHIFQAYTVGAVDVVFKPADPFILRSKVSILVDLYLKTAEVRRQAEEGQRLLAENARVSAEKEAAEDALARSRRRQEVILGSLPIVFHARMIEPPYPPIFVSDSVITLTGFSPSAFLDDPGFGYSRVHPDDRPIVDRAVRQALETGSYSCEYRWKRENGEYRVLLDQGIAAPEQDGEPPQILGSLLDTTDRRSLEEQLAQSRKMEAVGQLTGGVAHDFNNLLTVVLGNADILLRRTDDERLTRQLSAIRSAAERGQTLTRQLLAYSRRQQLNPVVVELNNLIRGFIPLMQQAVGDGVTITAALEDAPLCAWVDPTHLETALLNLAVNARDAMANEGRLDIRVQSTDLDGGAGVRIAFRDSGSGMPAEVAERIFEPFYTTKEIGKGSGLGLSQVYGFVTQSGGRVGVTSAPGEGALFELFLPLTAETPAENVASSSGHAPARGAERILVVEDDPSVLEMCVDMLVDLGYRCTTAGTAREALNRLKQDGEFDLLFSDVVMPGGVNGIHLARKATKIRPRLKVLLTSGYVGDCAAVETHEFQMIDKPYQQAALAARLRTILEEAAATPLKKNSRAALSV